MEKGEEKLEEDFDLYKIIQNAKQMRFELDKLKEKTNNSNDPDFANVNDKNTIVLDEIEIVIEGNTTTVGDTAKVHPINAISNDVE
jgi:hypothetical protein